MADLLDLLCGLGDAVADSIDFGRTGAVVSGGVDSSTIGILSRDYDDVPFFTGYYDHPSCDERSFARIANNVHGGEWHEILITPQDFVDNFDDMLRHIHPPYQGMGTFGQYMVGKYIAENTKVKTVLSGEGADELFGGYARLLVVAGEKLPDGYEKYWPPYGYPKNIKDALDYDYARLGDLLAVDDQCMAAHGLKAVAPFMDEQVVEFALSLPPGERIGKRTLKAAVRGIVPDAILDRTDKCGFPIPLVEWAQQNPVRDFVGDRIGYLPNPDKPWDRGFWLDLIEHGKPSPSVKHVYASRGLGVGRK